MPKITKRQKEKLLTYLTLLDDSGKVNYLYECGYSYAFSSIYNDFCFVRIDSVNWKQKYKTFKAQKRINADEKFYKPHEIYLKRLSQDFLFKGTEVIFEWSNVTNTGFDPICNYHVDLSFLN